MDSALPFFSLEASSSAAEQTIAFSSAYLGIWVRFSFSHILPHFPPLVEGVSSLHSLQVSMYDSKTIIMISSTPLSAQEQANICDFRKNEWKFIKTR